MKPMTTRAIALAVTIMLAATACTTKSKSTDVDQAASDLGDPGNCLVVNMSVSPEKIDLLTTLAKSFNSTKTTVGSTCIFMNPKAKASGDAMSALAEGWDEQASGPKPVVWSPASSAWGAILNQRLSNQGRDPMVSEGSAFLNTPLVIAMPKPMAEALGWPETQLGWSDILAMATNPDGWGAVGHPEWGPFRLGKTNPEFSTSGLHALIAQNYAANGKTRDLTAEDLAKRSTITFNEDIESTVMHYGDMTMTFLNNLYRADQQGTALTYASAVAVEEKSVIDYNMGNPDGILDPGEQPRPPLVPLVAIYPKEGTLFSDSPFFIVDAPWVSPELVAGAEAFSEFVMRPENQQTLLSFNFRPGNPDVAIGPPISPENGVNPDMPQTLLEVPNPPVMVEMLDRWHTQRKSAQVLLVIDVSGSMKERAGSGSSETKLDLAKQAAMNSLSQFGPDDIVGLRIFSTDLGPGEDQDFLDLVPLGPIRENADALRSAIEGLTPTNGTPLYDVTRRSFEDMSEQYDASRINAVVLLTDGMNDDGNVSDDNRQLNEALEVMREGSQGEMAKPIRLFTIGYGADADLNILRQLAEATNAASYNASDPRSITKVFSAVISNF